MHSAFTLFHWTISACIHCRFSVNLMNSRCLHFFPFNLVRIKFLVADWIGLSSILIFQFVSLLVLPLDETIEQGRNASRWLNLFLDFVFFSCVYAVLCFLPLFGSNILRSCFIWDLLNFEHCTNRDQSLM